MGIHALLEILNAHATELSPENRLQIISRTSTVWELIYCHSKKYGQKSEGHI